MLFCLFFCSVNDFSTTRGPMARFTPKFACWRTLVPDVSSPLLGVSGPRRTEKGDMKFSLLSYYGSQRGIFAFWRFLSDISATRGRIHTKFYLYMIMSADVSPPLWGPSTPGGGRGGELKTQKIGGWSHSCTGQLPFLFFSALPNVVQYVGHRPAHILV